MSSFYKKNNAWSSRLGVICNPKTNIEFIQKSGVVGLLEEFDWDVDGVLGIVFKADTLVDGVA